MEILGYASGNKIPFMGEESSIMCRRAAKLGAWPKGGLLKVLVRGSLGAVSKSQAESSIRRILKERMTMKVRICN